MKKFYVDKESDRLHESLFTDSRAWWKFYKSFISSNSNTPYNLLRELKRLRRRRVIIYLNWAYAKVVNTWEDTRKSELDQDHKATSIAMIFKKHERNLML